MKKVFLASIMAFFISFPLFCYESEDMEGRWYLACRTPIGIKQGYIDASFSSDTEFSGTISMFDHENEFEDGFFFGNEFFFTAKVRFLFMDIDIDAAGKIDGKGKVSADITAGIASFPAIAYRSQEELENALKNNPF